jgi:hypothetical protein
MHFNYPAVLLGQTVYGITLCSVTVYITDLPDDSWFGWNMWELKTNKCYIGLMCATMVLCWIMLLPLAYGIRWMTCLPVASLFCLHEVTYFGSIVKLDVCFCLPHLSEHLISLVLSRYIKINQWHSIIFHWKTLLKQFLHKAFVLVIIKECKRKMWAVLAFWSN